MPQTIYYKPNIDITREPTEYDILTISTADLFVATKTFLDEYYKDTADFFEKNKDGKFFYFSTKTQKIYSEVEYPDKSYLVFGKETAGLPEELLHANPEKCVRLPMINNSAARSLNLSNTVAIGVYEVLRQWNFPELLLEGKLTRFDW